MNLHDSTVASSEVASVYFTKLVSPCHGSSQRTLEDEETIVTKPETSDSAGFQMTNNWTNHSGIKRFKKQTANIYKKWARAEEVVTDKNEITNDTNYTALERQYLDLKDKYPDVLLLIETGYLYRFFGHDAEIAAEALKFKSTCRHHFVTTSLPTHRMHIHIRRLVALGHKVGVVKKTETALMKTVGDDQHGVFKRELTTLYTKSTLVGEEVDPAVMTEEPKDLRNPGGNQLAYLMCLYELPIGNGNTTRIGIFAACPLSGDLIYDCFNDDDKRQDLESRFARIRPVEVLVPLFSLSDATERTISTAVQCRLFEDGVRIERLSDEFFKFSYCEKCLRDFYNGYCDAHCNNVMSIIMDLPPPVICCMGAMLTYLKDFKLEHIFRLVREMKAFSPSSHHVNLDARTIHILELFRCSMNGEREGSLLSLLDQTSTAFGSRLLHIWLSQPLKSSCEIQQRLDAVDEIVNKAPSMSVLVTVKSLLEKLPDLESGIMAIFYKKCSPKKYWKTIASLIHAKQQLESVTHNISLEITGCHLKALILSTVSCLQGINGLLNNLDKEAVWKGEKHKLFIDLVQYPTLNNVRQLIHDTRQKLDVLQATVAIQLGQNTFQFSKFSDKEYVIVIRSSCAQEIPTDWKIVAQTSKNICYRTPEMEMLVKELKLLEEQFIYECHLIWLKYLEEFRSFYHSIRRAITNLATLDCYFSFAALAKSQDFVKPHIKSGTSTILDFLDVSHPVISRLLGPERQFVRNSTKLSSDGHLCQIITGANMGGKTSYARAVAIVAILAQIGSFVPASVVRLSPLDAIFVRSGVRDNILKGKSAFCMEAGEVSEILPYVTPRSLVLLDEFGRSTSDSDGASLACGILHHLITKVQCLSLVITRFPEVTKLQTAFPAKVVNRHMSVLIKECSDPIEERQEIHTYLYRLEEGVCDRGYATNVCRMAGIEEAVLNLALAKSTEMEQVNQNYRSSIKLFWKIFNGSWDVTQKCIQSLKMHDCL